MTDLEHLILEFQQIELIQKKLNEMGRSDIPKNKLISQIIDHIESANNFSASTVEDIVSNKIVLTENTLSIINHELKTPLVPMKAYADMLLQGKFGNLNAVQKEKVTIIASNIKRLQQKIEFLLDKRTLASHTPDDSNATFSAKELKQQNMLLEKINQLLTEKSNKAESEVQKLHNTIIESKHQKNEIKQERVMMNKLVQIEEQKKVRLTKKNLMMMATAALIVGAGFTTYSVYVVDLVGKQYQVSNLGRMPGGYLIQNLRGDTIDTWLSWRPVSDSTLHVGIMNGAAYPEKIQLIKEVVMSEESIDIDDSLLHKGPEGITSTYYLGWLGALKQASAKPTEFNIPVNLEVIESSRGEGEITIVLTNDRNADGYSGFTKSIADESQNQILKSTITIYEVDKLNDEQFKTILRHEFGHALGLAHSTAPEELMAPVIQTEYPYISECVIDSIVKLYDNGKNSQVVCEK
ncbi:MAG TPA: histidine kinase dimerization/phospho-acceptor domain-containing protein [Candidatus Nitrosotenuis sp.]